MVCLNLLLLLISVLHWWLIKTITAKKVIHFADLTYRSQLCISQSPYSLIWQHGEGQFGLWDHASSGLCQPDAILWTRADTESLEISHNTDIIEVSLNQSNLHKSLKQAATKGDYWKKKLTVNHLDCGMSQKQLKRPFQQKDVSVSHSKESITGCNQRQLIWYI